MEQRLTGLINRIFLHLQKIFENCLKNPKFASMFLRYTFLFLLLFTFFSGYSQTGSVKGYVKDIKTGIELDNILVEISGKPYNINSNSEGYYILTGITPGTYFLTAGGFGYDTDSIKVVIKEGSVKVVNFFLNPTIITVGSGKITDIRKRKQGGCGYRNDQDKPQATSEDTDCGRNTRPRSIPADIAGSCFQR
jgi:hypothetical protein